MKLAIITDIHEDIQSLQNALHMIEKHKCDDIVCLGDISGYSVPYYSYIKTRNAHQCLKLIQNNCKYIVLGNHDIHAGKIIPKNCMFFNYPENWYNLNYQQRHKLGNGLLWLHEENDLDPLYTEEDVKFLQTLPEFQVIQLQGLKILVSHYVYPNLSGLKKDFYSYKDEFDQHFDFMQEQQCMISFTGHSHVNGCIKVTKNKVHYCRSRTIKTNPFPVCIGIPPVTSNVKNPGFCIFDSKEKTGKLIKI